MALSTAAKAVLSELTEELWGTGLTHARLRWTGKGDPGNTANLLKAAEKELASAHPDVQWAMNFCLGWIGIHEPQQRARCVKLGEKVGLYKDEKVAPNCTPSYLPEFIRIESDKLSAG